jgi:hypothetical protein
MSKTQVININMPKQTQQEIYLADLVVSTKDPVSVCPSMSMGLTDVILLFI